MKEGFHSLELNHATWEVPQKYSKLAGIGAGAYGQVNHRLCQYQNTTILYYLSDLQLHLDKYNITLIVLQGIRFKWHFIL